LVSVYVCVYVYVFTCLHVCTYYYMTHVSMHHHCTSVQRVAMTTARMYCVVTTTTVS
jgi:hypothetical protein